MGGAEALLLERDELTDDMQEFDRQFDDEQQRVYTYKHDGVVETAHSIEEARSRCPVLGAMALELATALVELPRDDREDDQDSADWLKSMMSAEASRAASTDATVKVHHEPQTVAVVESAVQSSYEQQLPVRHHDELALSPLVGAAEVLAVAAAGQPPSRETGSVDAMPPPAIAPVETVQDQGAIVVNEIMPGSERETDDAASHIETAHVERQTIERIVEEIPKPRNEELEVLKSIVHGNGKPKVKQSSPVPKTAKPMTLAAVTSRPEITPQVVVAAESDALDVAEEVAEVLQLQYRADVVGAGLRPDDDEPMPKAIAETVAAPVLEREHEAEADESPINQVEPIEQVEAAEVLLQVLQEDDIVMDQAPLAQFAQQLERLPVLVTESNSETGLEQPVEMTGRYTVPKDAENTTEYTAEANHTLTKPPEAVDEVHSIVVERLEMLKPEMSEIAGPRLEELVQAIQEMSRLLADPDSTEIVIIEAELAMVDACQEVLRTLGIPATEKLVREFARHLLLVEGLQRLQAEHAQAQNIEDGMHERKHFGPLQNWQRMMQCIRKQITPKRGVGRYAMLLSAETV